MLDEQADQIFAMTDPIAERVRKLGGTTLRSIGQIARLQRVLDNDADTSTPRDMLAELREDNKQLAAGMREAHELCDEHDDVATASLIENWIDETERRTWFLFEAGTQHHRIELLISCIDSARSIGRAKSYRLAAFCAASAGISNAQDARGNEPGHEGRRDRRSGHGDELVQRRIIRPRATSPDRN